MGDNSLRLQARIVEFVGQFAPGGLAAFTLDRELLCELHAIAMDGEPCAGKIRTEDVQIGSAVVLFMPPRWQEVEGHLQTMFEHIASAQSAAAPSALHVAAYALWRLCWIHPFDDGNGRTARAIAYALLCVGLGRPLPGSPAVPELIALNRYPYWDALRAADRAWAAGALDVSEMEQVLDDLAEQQIASATT
jgi:hypothetical protein